MGQKGWTNTMHSLHTSWMLLGSQLVPLMSSEFNMILGTYPWVWMRLDYSLNHQLIIIQNAVFLIITIIIKVRPSHDSLILMDDIEEGPLKWLMTFWQSSQHSWGSGGCVNIKAIFPIMRISIINIRQSWEHLIFIMGISMLERWHVDMEMAPRCQTTNAL